MRWLLDRFSTEPESVAFIHDGEKVVYGAMLSRISSFSALISEHGISTGCTVVVLADYSPDVFCFIVALALNKNVVVPLTRDSVVEKDIALSVSGCDWFVEFQDDGKKCSIVEKHLPVENDLLVDLKAAGRPGLVLFSSGSTGLPKGILHDFSNVVEKFRVPRSKNIAIPFLSLDHFGGINTILSITSSLGTAVTVRSRLPRDICEAVQSYGITLLPATPSFLTMLVAARLHREYDLSSIKRITYGTEVMPQVTLSRMRDCFPNVLLQQTYGLSEVGVLGSRSRDDGSLWLKVGGDGFETKIVNDILFIRSKYRMLGYLNAPSGFDSDGWFDTKDCVEVDGDYIKILGRITDIINVGGQKVYPTEIENVIVDIDNVSDVVVYAEKSALLGHIIVAKVNLLEPETLQELKRKIRKICKERLTAYKVPAKVVVSTESLHTARFKKVRK